MNKKFLNTKTMILCSLFTALIAIGAFIRIPFPVTVFSFQFTFVLLAGVLLGAKRGGTIYPCICIDRFGWFPYIYRRWWTPIYTKTYIRIPGSLYNYSLFGGLL